MYWFGENRVTTDELLQKEEWAALPAKRLELYKTSIEDILNLLDSFSRVSFEDAVAPLIQETSFSEDEVRKTLSLLPEILRKENLQMRLRGEFSNFQVLDQYSKMPGSQVLVRAVPLGIVLHVTAGNVFLSAIDSLIMAFLTKNLSIVKVSSRNKVFPLLFAKKLQEFDQKKLLSDKFGIVHWKGGDEKVESFFKKEVHAIVGWGGEEMISSYRRDLPPHVKFLDFGPKISLQVITKESLKGKNLQNIAEKVVADIIPWDQEACSSPQNLYLQEGISEKEFLKALDEAFQKAPPRGRLDEDVATEILKEKYRGYYSELMDGGLLQAGKEHLIHLEKNALLKPSPLHRTLVVKKFKNEEDLFNNLIPFSYYLQSCSYLLGESEKSSYLNILSLTGIKRFAPLRTVTFGMNGAPHDGRFVLRELVHFIGDEVRAVDYGEEIKALNDSSSLKEHFESSSVASGYVFSSGGTTGTPKYVNFSYSEMDYMTDMLAENYSRQGIKSGMKVANLFVAGNLWSSFLAVDKAMEKIGAVQLPIGGLSTNENIYKYLQKLKPEAVLGIPSLLVMNAAFSASQDEKLSIPMVFYAGEHLSEARRQLLSQSWGTTYFGSGGYASVDGGVIGYQCEQCGPGEHHLFSDLVDMKIIEEEAVVTSIIRSSMPIKNYRTGDRVEWIPDCKCGRKDKRFKLLGRTDNQLHIWSCRLLCSDVEALMNENGILSFQMKVEEKKEDGLLKEKITLFYESPQKSVDKETLLVEIFNRSRDVKDTIKIEDFKKGLDLVEVGRGEIPRNPRTGKISLIRDERK